MSSIFLIITPVFAVLFVHGRAMIELFVKIAYVITK
jgi:hypothetical protein